MSKITKQYKKYFIILFFVFFLSGCSAKEQLDKLDHFLASYVNNEDSGASMDNKEIGGFSDEENKVITFKDLTDEQKVAIDKWLKQNGYNRYGDSLGAMYAGGTPLFDEASAQGINRFEYILSKHPDILSKIK